MEELKNWVTSIAVSSILISVLKILLPNNNNGKAAKVLVSIVFLMIVITPFINNKISFNIEEIYDKTVTLSQQENTQEIVKKQLIETTQKGIKEDVIKIIESNKESYEEIDVIVTANEKNEIFVSEILVKMKNLQKPDTIGDLLKEKYGCEVKIISSEE